MAKFCSQCGFSVGENDKFCPDCGTLLRTRAELEFSDHYCSECGAPIIVRTAEAVYRPRQEGAPPPEPPQRRPASEASAQRELPAAPPARTAKPAVAEDEHAHGSSGCSVFFWLVILAGAIWACYTYIYLPYQASRGADETYVIPPSGSAIYEERTGPTYTIPPRDDGGSKVGGDASGDSSQSVGPNLGDASSTGTQGWIEEPRPDRQGYSTVTPGGQQGPMEPQFDLQLVSFMWQPVGLPSGRSSVGPSIEAQQQTIVAEGEIMNIAASPLTTVIAVVKFMTITGAEIAHQRVTVNRLPLLIGERARFRAEMPFDGRVYSVIVDFVNTNDAAYSVKRTAVEQRPY